MFTKKKIGLLFLMALTLLVLSQTAFAANPTITVASTEGVIGDTVDVTIDISDNPGIISMLLSVDYDEALTLTKVTNGTILAGAAHNVNNLTAKPYTLSWADDLATQNNTANGTIVTLTFSVSEDANVGDEFAVNVSYDNSNAAIYDMDFNLIDFAIENGTITAILPPPIEGVTFANAEFTYDGAEHEVVAAGIPEGATVVYTIEGVEGNSAVEAGEYVVDLLVEKEGFRDFEASANLTILPREVEVSLNVEDKTFDNTTAATVATYEISNVIDGDDVALNVENAQFASKNAGANIAVTADIELVGEDEGNYVLPVVVAAADIVPAKVYVTANDAAIYVGQQIPELTYEITEGELYGEYTVSGIPATNANKNAVGTYAVTIGTVTAGNNYEVVFTNGVFTVMPKKTQNVSVANIVNKTYGDADFTLEVATSENGLGGFTFESNKPEIAEVNADGTVTIHAAGEAKITVKREGNFEYLPFEKAVNIVINKKALNISAIDFENRTVTLEGMLASDTEVTVAFNDLAIEIGEKDEAANVYAILVNATNLSGTASENYCVNEFAGTVPTDYVVVVTLNVENGSVTGDTLVIKGNTASFEFNVDSGCRFDGWYSENDELLSENSIYSFVAEEDVVIVAKASEVGGGFNIIVGSSTSRKSQITVKFNSNGGSKVKSVTVAQNSSIAAPRNPVKEGYVFGGWYIDRAFTTPYTFGKKVTINFTLHAKWNPKAEFIDVAKDAWYFDDVDYVQTRSLMLGTADNVFSPDAVVNRAMLVTVLWRLEGSPVVKSNVKFNDVPAGEWYTDAVNWASANGIVNGYGDGVFAPMDALTHEQVMAILNRYAISQKWSANVSGVTSGSYINSDWSESNIFWAESNGMFEGIGSDVTNLTEGTERAELAAYLRRFCVKFINY